MMLSDVIALLVEKLNADEWLARNRWRAAREDDGDIGNALAANVHAGDGCLIVVICGTFDSETNSSKNPVGPLGVTLACVEKPSLNRFRNDHATALHVAEHVACALNLEQLGGDTFAKPSIKLETLEEGVITYNVTLTLHHVLRAGHSQIPKSPNP